MTRSGAVAKAWTTGAALLRSLRWVAVLLTVMPASAVHAATFTVNSAVDEVDALPGDGLCATASGKCTLRAAVMEADALPGADTIQFDAALDGVPIVLTIAPVDTCPPLGCYNQFVDPAEGDLDISEDLNVIGNGPAKTIIQWPDPAVDPAALRDRIFSVVSPTCYRCVAVSISGVTVRFGGEVFPGGGGRGGIDIGGGNVLTTITDSVISDNRGSGIRSGFETLLLDRVTVARNAANGGAGLSVWYLGQVTVNNSTFSDNVADNGAGGGRGGAVLVDNGNSSPDIVLISNSTLSGNRAATGCAIYDASGGVRLHDVTVANNCAAGSGGPALVAGAQGEGFGTVNVRNSVIVSPPGVVDCATESSFAGTGTFLSDGYNLIGDASCGLAGAGDVQGTGALLGPLADNGGPTWTHLPLVGSPAIDTGTPVDCPATDQRGSPRPRDGDGNGIAGCDKGAVELGAGPPPPPPTTGLIRGVVWDDANFDGIRDPGEPGFPGLSLCLFPSAPLPCLSPLPDGTYQFTSLTPGTYYVYEKLPSNRMNSTPRWVQVTVAAGGAVNGVDFGSFVPPPPPPAWGAPAFAQRVFKGSTFSVQITAPCAASAVTATVTYGGTPVSKAMVYEPFTNSWSVEFSTPGPGFLPLHIEANCTALVYDGFIEFIDPSGTILDGCTGQPLAGATVMLQKNDPFGSSTYATPDPAEHRPARNPELTIADGFYGWDVVPGRWRVQVSKPGYDTVTTDPFDVPPPKLGLDITLMPTAGCNTPPVANNDAYATDQGTTLTVSAPGVLANDTDANHDVLHTVRVTNAAHGAVTLAADGSFTYAPSATFSGTDSFTYKASDGRDDSNVATVTITVRKVNRPPVAKDDAYATTKNRAFFIAAPGVLANDKDPEGSSLTAVLVQKAAHGVVLLSVNGSFVYIPKSGFVGKDTFTYKASDGVNASNTATVTINVVKKDKRDKDDEDDDDRGEHEQGEKDRR